MTFPVDDEDIRFPPPPETVHEVLVAWQAGRLVGGPAGDTRTTRVYLAAAQLDHDPGNSHPRNLADLCQRCHLQRDRPGAPPPALAHSAGSKAVGDLPLCTLSSRERTAGDNPGTIWWK